VTLTFFGYANVLNVEARTIAVLEQLALSLSTRTVKHVHGLIELMPDTSNVLIVGLSKVGEDEGL
jgi:hypothetical protein